MAAPISEDLRRRVVESVNDGLTYKQAADQFSVGDASVSRWLRLARENGSVAASPMGGSMPILGEAEREILRGLVEQEPDLTLAELGYQLKEVTGLTVSVSTLSRVLWSMGISRKKRRSSTTEGRMPTSWRSGRRFKQPN